MRFFFFEFPYISDFKKLSALKVAFDPEFAARLEPKLLDELYGKITCHQLMDQVLLYFSLGSGAVDVSVRGGRKQPAI